MTGSMLIRLGPILQKEKPAGVLIYGDTNSTLAGALAAAKLHIPVAHVEAGLRSFNRQMPEEINRVIADHLSTLLFCPTTGAVKNLRNEGIVSGVVHTGDVMYDAARLFAHRAKLKSAILETLGLVPKKYVLVTIHRAENTDNLKRLTAIIEAFAEIAITMPVVFPVHPRTRKMLSHFKLLKRTGSVTLIDPVGFLDMVLLESNARLIMTDSGGVQKEAYFHSVPCVTLRDETEWVETVASGWNRLVDTSDSAAIVGAIQQCRVGKPIREYGNGDAALKIVKCLLEILDLA
jgi:UDP-GlcNAc3NAcA epimerase